MNKIITNKSTITHRIGPNTTTTFPTVMSKGESGMSSRLFRVKRVVGYQSPKKGEWYLSGAIPQIWQAPNDLGPDWPFIVVKIQEVKKTPVIQYTDI